MNENLSIFGKEVSYNTALALFIGLSFTAGVVCGIGLFYWIY